MEKIQKIIISLRGLFSVFWIVSTLITIFIFSMTFQRNNEMRLESLKFEEKYHIDLLSETLKSQLSVLESELLIQGSHALFSDFSGETHSWELELLAQEYKNFMILNTSYDQIRLLRKDGQEICRVNSTDNGAVIIPRNELQNKFDRYYFQETLKLAPGEIYMSPMDLNVENNQVEMPHKPMIRIGTPVINKDNDITGYLMLNYKADRIRDHIKPATFSTISELSLINTEGYWLVTPDNDKEWGFMFEDSTDITVFKDFPIEAETIYASQSDQFLTDTGLFTFSTINPETVFKRSSEVSNISTDETIIREWKLLSFISTEKIEVLSVNDRLFYTQIIFVLAALYGLLFFFIGSYIIKKRKTEIEKEHMITELKAALEEVKTLSGLLPVCSGCHKIRDDKGYWEQIEHYIEINSDVQFSHSLCPNCVKDMYKDEPWYDKMQKESENNSDK